MGKGQSAPEESISVKDDELHIHKSRNLKESQGFS